MVGTTLDSSAALITFFKDQSTINFHLASANHLTVCASPRRSQEAIKICKRLAGMKYITPIHEKYGKISGGVGTFRPADEVLREHANKIEWQQHIHILAEAWDEAPQCEFQYDTILGRTLNGLLTFAKAKADPTNQLKPNEFLASQAGLGHFGGDIGLHAKTKYASDYSACYKGVYRVFPLHVTLGMGLNPKYCMSIYMDWDPEIQKLVIARFGRHGRGA